MKTIKWGIVGAGKISATFAEALNSLKNTELTAIASRSLDKAQDFANRFHIKKAYGSYEELAMDPEIDVVYIGTPHTEHMANTELCLRNKKAVLCEKPFTVNHKETEYLISLARENKVFLMEAMWTKFLPATKTVKSWIKDGKIGNIKYFNVNFGYQAEYDPKGRLLNPELAGGALLDVGIYPITYVIHMMDRLPDKVTSLAYIGHTNVDEINTLSFLYEDGTVAELSSSVTTNIGHDALIVGDKGKIEVPSFWRADSAKLYDASDNLIETFSMPVEPNNYIHEAEEVNRCLREGKLESDLLPLQDTLAIMKVMDDIRAAWGLVYPSEMR